MSLERSIYERGQQWQDSALCAQTDPQQFYPEGKGKGRAQAKTAKQICGECEVSAQCLEASIEGIERWGIWGGLDEDQRLPLINERLQSRGRAAIEDDMPAADAGDEWVREVA